MYRVRALDLAVRIACLALFGLSAVHAQTSFAAITGSITDASGAPVPQVAIKATNVDTGASVSTASNESGNYNILSLIPGPYRLEVQKAGFERTDVEHVVLSSAQTATVDIVIKIGKVSETVTVSAQSPLLTPSSPTVATTVEKEIVTEMPYPERGTLGVALLVAG